MGVKRDGDKKFFENYEIRELEDSRIRRDDCIPIKEKILFRYLERSI